MLDIAEELHRWAGQGRSFAVATVVAVGGSAPRQPGAALAVDSDGTAVGSVSGGCVEGAVYELCRQAIEDGTTVRERFGYSDDDAFAVGLTCGGVIDILVTPVRADDPARPVFAAAFAAAAEGRAAAVARVTEGPAELLGRPLLVHPDGAYAGGLGGPAELDRTAAAEARAMLDTGRTGELVIGAEGSRCGSPLTLLVESSVPPPRMIVFGAIDFAAALVRAGRFLGYRVTVCDARPVFATAPGSPRPTRSSSTGRTATSPAPRWTHARCSASSRTTPSSMSPCWNWRCGFRSPTSERWAPAVPIWSATSGFARRVSPTANGPRCTHRSGSTSARVRPRRRLSPSRRRSSPTGVAAPDCR